MIDTQTRAEAFNRDVEIDRLRNALKFYADINNYMAESGDGTLVAITQNYPIAIDSGMKARKALKEPDSVTI